MYYIYHIPAFKHKNGKIGKIGCTTNYSKRVYEQGYTNYEIIEEHTDIMIASQREIQLQKEYGYPIDRVPYSISIEHQLKASKSGGGKIGGKIVASNNVKSGRWAELQKLATIKNKKYVIQYTKSGQLIKEWKGVREVGRSLNIAYSNIAACCQGKLKSAGGYVWKYKE